MSSKTTVCKEKTPEQLAKIAARERLKPIDKDYRPIAIPRDIYSNLKKRVKEKNRTPFPTGWVVEETYENPPTEFGVDRKIQGPTEGVNVWNIISRRTLREMIRILVLPRGAYIGRKEAIVVSEVVEAWLITRGIEIIDGRYIDYGHFDKSSRRYIPERYYFYTGENDPEEINYSLQYMSSSFFAKLVAPTVSEGTYLGFEDNDISAFKEYEERLYVLLKDEVTRVSLRLPHFKKQKDIKTQKRREIMGVPRREKKE